MSASLNLVPIRPTYQIAKYDAMSRNDSLQWLRSESYMRPIDQMKFYDTLKTRRDIEYFHLESEGKIVGICGLTDIQYGLSAEFSLLIHTNQQRQGFGRKALLSLMQYGFSYELDLKLIYGETFIYPPDYLGGIDFKKENYLGKINPAWKLFEALGFKIEGITRMRYSKAGVPVDSLHFSMTRERFTKLYTWLEVPK